MSNMMIGHNANDRTVIELPRDDLSTHALVVGCTGSGKTGLVHVLIEEAVLQGASAVVLDPKGDLTNLLLAFPGLTPAEFAPWVPAGKDPVTEAKKWADGLRDTDQSASRVASWRNAAHFRIFTPGLARSGQSVNLLPSTAAPHNFDEVFTRERAAHIVNTVLNALGSESDPLTDPKSVFLTELLMLRWRNGQDCPLEQWPGLIITPPEQLRNFDGIAIDDFFSRKERAKLASAIVGFRRQAARWLEGTPINMDLFLMPAPDGRPRVNVFTLKHLSHDDRMLFTSMFLSALVDWMFKLPASGRLRALCVLDEAAGYLPPVQKPPTKRPICTLLAQGRAQGIGVLIATQNPNDIDYKALSNVRTWFLGGLRDRDMKRDLELALKERGVDPSKLLRLPERSFLALTKDGETHTLKVRWSLSYLRGPIEATELGKLATNIPIEEAKSSTSKLNLTKKAQDVCAGDISVGFDLTDDDLEVFDVEVLYSTDKGKTWQRATPCAEWSNPMENLQSSDNPGIHYEFMWDSLTDLGRRFVPSVRVMIQAIGMGGVCLPPFDVCNHTLDV